MNIVWASQIIIVGFFHERLGMLPDLQQGVFINKADTEGCSIGLQQKSQFKDFLYIYRGNCCNRCSVVRLCNNSVCLETNQSLTDWSTAHIEVPTHPFFRNRSTRLKLSLEDGIKD